MVSDITIRPAERVDSREVTQVAEHSDGRRAEITIRRNGALWLVFGRVLPVDPDYENFPIVEFPLRREVDQPTAEEMATTLRSLLEGGATQTLSGASTLMPSEQDPRSE